jgi:hypothetical protein
MKPYDLPSEIDERLWEWAAYFRDYRPTGRCASLEGRYQRHSDDMEADGVSEESREAPKPPRPRDWVLRAIATHDAIQQLDKQYKWALTYAYCYPGLPKFVVLRLMKKYTGRGMAWARFLDVVDIARMRVWTMANTQHLVSRACSIAK